MTIDDPVRALIASYAPRDRRASFAALLALDDALGQVLRTTRQPIVGQMRLAWWREALVRLDASPPPGEPVLIALAAEVLPRGVTGAMLARLVDGWEPLLGVIDNAAFAAHGEDRGAALFRTAGSLLGSEAMWLSEAGRGWALADLSINLRDDRWARLARAQAILLLDIAARRHWPRAIRPLGALVRVERRRLQGPMSASHVLRLGWHRLTGR